MNIQLPYDDWIRNSQCWTMTHAGSPRNLMQWKGSWSDSDFNMVEDDHFMLWGKVAQISTNHKPNGDKNSSSRIRFILWLIRVWNVIISDFHHQRFSRDTLCAWRKKSANDLQIILRFYSLRLCVFWFFFFGGVGGEGCSDSKLQILQSSKGMLASDGMNHWENRAP